MRCQNAREPFNAWITITGVSRPQRQSFNKYLKKCNSPSNGLERALFLANPASSPAGHKEQLVL